MRAFDDTQIIVQSFVIPAFETRYLEEDGHRNTSNRPFSPCFRGTTMLHVRRRSAWLVSPKVATWARGNWRHQWTLYRLLLEPTPVIRKGHVWKFQVDSTNCRLRVSRDDRRFYRFYPQLNEKFVLQCVLWPVVSTSTLKLQYVKPRFLSALSFIRSSLNECTTFVYSKFF